MLLDALQNRRTGDGRNEVRENTGSDGRPQIWSSVNLIMPGIIQWNSL